MNRQVYNLTNSCSCTKSQQGKEGGGGGPTSAMSGGKGRDGSGCTEEGDSGVMLLRFDRVVQLGHQRWEW
jgi:hypothetical protein